MLKKDDLQKKLKEAFSGIIPQAIETCMKNNQKTKSKKGDKDAEEFAKSFDEIVSDQLATAISSAIDYYIKNADITGTIITNGGPTTQVAQISPPPTPIVGGKIPNTFGIN